MTKIEIKNLSILFGSEKNRAKKMILKGKSKQEILKETGCTVAVRNANLEIEEGEMFVIMGLSGSGKSTLLRCINRLNEPTMGEIRVNGIDITRSSDKELLQIRRKELAMVFQHFGLLPHRTVLSNVSFGLELQSVLRFRPYSALQEKGIQIQYEDYEQVYWHGCSRRTSQEKFASVSMRSCQGHSTGIRSASAMCLC